MNVLTIIALGCFTIIALFRPCSALAVLLLTVPFGHLAHLHLAMPNFGGLVRFTVIGVPFTFPEAAVYVLAGAITVRSLFASSRAREAREKFHTVVPPSNGARSLAEPALSRVEWGLGMTRWGDPWILLPLLWILVAAIAAYGSPAGVRAWGIWKAYVVAPVLLFWIIRALRDELDTIRHIVVPLAAGAFVVAVVAIAQYWWPIGVPYPWSMPGRFRATSVFGYPNAVGLYVAPLVPLFVGVAIVTWVSLRGAQPVQIAPRFDRAQRRSNPESVSSHGIATLGPDAIGASLAMTFAFACVAALSVLAIILAKSTGALVALIAAAPALAWCWWSARRRTSKPSAMDYTDIYDRANECSARGGARWAVVVIGAWVAASLVLTAWFPYRHEQSRWGSPIVRKLTFQQWSGVVRLAQYRETWALLRDHPIRGAGLAAYQSAIRPYHEDPRVEVFLYPHNLLLAVWVELGIAGLLVFLVILHQFFRTFFSPPPNGRGSGRGWGWYEIIAAMLVVLVHGLVDVPYFRNDLAMVFWAIVGLAVVVGVEKTAPPSYGTT